MVAAPIVSNGDRFYSPLVRNIASKEGISQTELDTVPGSGKDGRVTKNDIKAYLKNRATQMPVEDDAIPVAKVEPKKEAPVKSKPKVIAKATPQKPKPVVNPPINTRKNPCGTMTLAEAQSDPILFETGSDQISEEALGVLDQIAEKMKG